MNCYLQYAIIFEDIFKTYIKPNSIKCSPYFITVILILGSILTKNLWILLCIKYAIDFPFSSFLGLHCNFPFKYLASSYNWSNTPTNRQFVWASFRIFSFLTSNIPYHIYTGGGVYVYWYGLHSLRAWTTPIWRQLR